MAKLILMTSMIVGYAYVAENFMAWYSGSPYEWGQFYYRATGQYALFYWIMIVCNIVAPIPLWFSSMRKNIKVLFIISLLINVGMWFERFNIIVISLSRGYDPGAWGIYIPTWVELGITVGSFAWFFMFFLIFIKTLPAISIVEMKELLPVPKKGGR